MKRSSFLKSLFAIPAAIAVASKVEAAQKHTPVHSVGVECINGECMPIQCDLDPEYGRCVECVPTPVNKRFKKRNRR